MPGWPQLTQMTQRFGRRDWPQLTQMTQRFGCRGWPQMTQMFGHLGPPMVQMKRLKPQRFAA